MDNYYLMGRTYKGKLRDMTSGIGPLLLLMGLFLLAAALSSVPWLAPDWENFYRPGALSARPNDVFGNYAPPWTYPVLWPIAVLGDGLSKGVLTLATVFVCWRFMGSWRRFALLCLTMPFVATVAFGQIDTLSLVGLMAPADLSLLFLTMKPQGAILAALKERLTVRSVCILLILVAVSLLLWGWWPASLLARTDWSTDCSPWPYGIPFGLGLLYWQWKRGFDSDSALCVATLLLVPYFFYTSMLPAVAATIKEMDDDWPMMLLVVGVTWLMVIFAGVGL